MTQLKTIYHCYSVIMSTIEVLENSIDLIISVLQKTSEKGLRQ